VLQAAQQSFCGNQRLSLFNLILIRLRHGQHGSWLAWAQLIKVGQSGRACHGAVQVA